MEFLATRATLEEALTKISGAVTSSSSLPVLEHVLIEVEGNDLILKATDLELSLETAAKINGESNGSCSVPARKFQNLVQSLPSGDTEFSLKLTENEQVAMTVEEINSEFLLPALPSDEFPGLPEPEADNLELDFKLPCDKLIDMLRNTQFAASTDATRGYLGGVLFDLGEDELTVVATDSHRLALHKLEYGDSTPEAEGSILVPVGAIKELVKILPDEGEVQVVSDGNLTEFIFNDSRLVSRLIDEDFPDYHRVIPEDYENRTTIDCNRLLDAVKRVSLVADEKTRRLILAFSPSELTVKAENTEEGQGEERLNIEGGEELEIAFNGDYLAEVLKHIRDDQIHLDLISADSPGTFRPLTAEDYLYIVMPMRLT